MRDKFHDTQKNVIEGFLSIHNNYFSIGIRVGENTVRVSQFIKHTTKKRKVPGS